jgi:alpha-tubulin suppressor-like RCC1 family protein
MSVIPEEKNEPTPCYSGADNCARVLYGLEKDAEIITPKEEEIPTPYVASENKNMIFKEFDTSPSYTQGQMKIRNKEHAWASENIWTTESTELCDVNPIPYLPTNNYDDDCLDTIGKIYGTNCIRFLDRHPSVQFKNCILKPEPIPYFNNITILSVDTGTYHTIFLDKQGNTYGIGRGFGYKDRAISGGTPEKLFNLSSNYKNTTQYCGYHHTVIKNIADDLHGLCNTEESILGGGENWRIWSLKPITYYSDVRFYYVSAGLSHTLYIDTNNNVYAAGYNDEGQLGIGLELEAALSTTLYPILYFKDIQMSSVSAGAAHSIFLDKRGKVYYAGSNDCGQLGIGNRDIQKREMPGPIKYFDDIPIASIYTGSFYTIFLDTQGKVYGVGSNEFGQLGLGDNECRFTPEPITYFNDIPIANVSAGDRHVIFLDTQGKVYSTGSNKFGQLGLGDKNNRTLPEPIPYFKDIKIESMSAGGVHTVFIDTIGKVYAVGYNENEQLGIKNIKDIPAIQDRKEEIEIYWLVRGENRDEKLVERHYRDSDGNLVYEY